MEYTYTSNLENEIWSLAEELDENEDISIAVGFLNSKEGFQPFGTRLATFIADKLDLASTDSETVRKAIKKKCSENGMELSEIASYNTLRSWFESDQRPKKGNGSRQSMFALAFAINLSVDETKELFHKIYLDRAFNYRDVQEIIFYFCLKNNKTWADATRLIMESENAPKDYSDKTQATKAIIDGVNVIQSEAELLDYIGKNGNNFQKNNRKAKEIFDYYLSLAKSLTAEEKKLDRVVHGQKNNKSKEKSKNAKLKNATYYQITGLNPSSGEKGTITFFKNANLPKEIKNRFPEAATFSKEHEIMTSEEYRKVIILLFSFCFWYQIQYTKKEYGFDDYEKEINIALLDCNYPELYYGNPFDWMFMYCSYTSTQADFENKIYYQRPLDLFIDLIEEVMK